MSQNYLVKNTHDEILFFPKKSGLLISNSPLRNGTFKY